MGVSSIQLSTETKAALKKLRKQPRESYEDTIKRLIGAKK